MSGEHPGRIVSPIRKDKLADFVARRILSEIKDHGGIGEFGEKFAKNPMECSLDLAFASIDCIDLCQMLRTEADFGMTVTSKPGVP